MRRRVPIGARGGGRGSAGATGQNVDSLLDTMANVVGILVVLMAVIQLTVNDAMKRIQIWESDEAVQLRAERSEADSRLAAAAGVDLERSLELARLREHLRELRALSITTASASSTASVAADVARQRMQLRDLEASLDDGQQKLVNLRILLAESEARAEQESIAVRLPDPRPAPLAAQQLVWFSRYGRAFDPRFAELSRELDTVVRSAPRPLDRYFSSYDVGNELLRWRVSESADGLVHRLDWRRLDIGETPEELQSPRAALRARLAEIDPQKHFIYFYVWGDSFEVYLEARRIAEEAGFSVGWVPIPAGKPLELVKSRSPLTPVD